MAQFFNQATLSYNNTVVNSNIATGELLEVLSASKTAVDSGYGAGRDVTYIISIVNSGATAFTGLTVTDDLGGYTVGGTTVYPLEYTEGTVRYFVNGVLQPAPTVTAGPPVVISGIGVPAGGDVVIAYSAETTQFAPPASEGSITNTATVTGGGISTPVTASETLPVLEGPILSVNKSISPSTVTENSRVTYTFVIQNSGNADAAAADNTVITDLFDPILSDITVSFNGVAWSEPTDYTYNETTGLFATVAGRITVPAATYTQDPATGAWSTTPGYSVLTVTGTI